ncbi:MAG TPA: carboxypeptidase regulatory-like domain-containing protein [bacterium]|nr:carboxypeptidase regulatory-like domain-containing protein [bacterium]
MKRLAAVLTFASLVATCMPAQDAAAAKTCTVEVFGTLLDDAFQPVAGVPLTIVTDDERDYRKAIRATPHASGPDGRIALRCERDPDKTTYLLLGGRKFAIHRVSLPESGRKDLGALALARGFTAVGRVRTPDGEPLQDAYVEGSDLLDSREFLRSVRYRQVAKCATRASIPANGVFLLPGMVRSAGEIRVVCPGYEDAVVGPVAMGSPLDLTLRPARTINGRVVDEQGQPVAEASVYTSKVKTTTADDGSFTLHLRDPLASELHAALTTAERNLVAAPTDIPKDGSEATLTLKPSGYSPESVVVRAVDADGKPLRAFRAFVACERKDQLRYRNDAMLLGQASRKRGCAATTDTGEVTLRHRSFQGCDTVIVFARAPGHGWGRIEVPRDEAAEKPQVVRLTKPGRLGGRIENADTGEPMAGVTIVATTNLDDQVKQHFEMGFYSVANLCQSPDATVSQADGSWQIVDTPPGKLHLFACMDNHPVAPIRTLEMAPGEESLAITWKIPPRRTLTGKLVGASIAPGLQIRPHWHRPDMSSSAWSTEYDGAVPIAADGSFRFVDLPPLDYRLQTVLPMAPRGGLRIKINGPLWKAANPPQQPLTVNAPTIVDVTGHVAGEVPWSRLAVLAYERKENLFHWQFAPPGVVAPLAADRTYRLQLPRQRFQLMMFDMLTGIVIEHREVEPDDLANRAEWSGKAVAFALDLRDTVAGARLPVVVAYTPTEDHWPLRAPPGTLVGALHRGKSGMQTQARAGEPLELYLPDRSGTLAVTCGKQQFQVDVATLAAPRLSLTVSPTAIQRSGNERRR